MNQNDGYRHLMDALPADVERRMAMGVVEGSLRLIYKYLSRDCQRVMFPGMVA